ncbi:unnamed protein product [Parnassius mnemosyne]|uniref:BED-type domain-containing protein n=1 Tax=Parnassius mnemosyne TaxID=213953 RepID=A0AAV1M5X6_9NEOP
MYYIENTIADSGKLRQNAKCQVVQNGKLAQNGAPHKCKRILDSSLNSEPPAVCIENILENVPGSSGLLNTQDPSAGLNIQHTITKRVATQEKTSSKKRRYDESYLSFGFVPVGMTENSDGQCVICNKIISNSSLVPAKLKRHLDTNHPELKDKSVSFFERHKEVRRTGAAAIQKFVKTDNENAT